MTDTNFPEAGAVVFTSFKRKDGFIVNITLRDKTGEEALKRMDGAIIKILKDGGVPYEKQSGFAKKQVEYVPDRVCPKCGNKLVYQMSKAGKLIKCETNKWDFATKKATGCPFVEFPKPSGFEQDMEQI